MCGIVGFVGREEAAPILLEGLRQIEYRAMTRRESPSAHRKKACR